MLEHASGGDETEAVVWAGRKPKYRPGANHGGPPLLWGITTPREGGSRSVQSVRYALNRSLKFTFPTNPSLTTAPPLSSLAMPEAGSSCLSGACCERPFAMNQVGKQAAHAALNHASTQKELLPVLSVVSIADAPWKNSAAPSKSVTIVSSKTHAPINCDNIGRSRRAVDATGCGQWRDIVWLRARIGTITEDGLVIIRLGDDGEGWKRCHEREKEQTEGLSFSWRNWE